MTLIFFLSRSLHPKHKHVFNINDTSTHAFVHLFRLDWCAYLWEHKQRHRMRLEFNIEWFSQHALFPQYFSTFLRIARFFLSKWPVFIWTFNNTVEYYRWRSYFCYWEHFWITKQNHIWRFNNGDFSVNTKIHSVSLNRVLFWTFKIFDDLLWHAEVKCGCF